MPQSLKNENHIIHREKGNALEGDQILVQCRKHGPWRSIRGSGNHNYFTTALAKNAYAVITKAFTNIKQ